MGNTNQPNKYPFLAGFLSAIFPGLGQFYNEQLSKGVLILSLFLGSGFIMVILRNPFFLDPFHVFSGSQFHPPFSIYHAAGVHHWSRFMPVFWFFLVGPIIYIFSIADAVISANRINEVDRSSRAAPTGSPTSEDVMNQQETLRQEAQDIMGDTPETEKKETKHTRRKRQHAMSFKFVFGLILVIFGTLAILPELDIDVEEWWHALWPLIPLVLGLRLLKDYVYEKEHGQFILGMIFTLIGVIFLLENWEILPMWSLISDFWEIALIVFGLLLMIMDSLERHTFFKHKDTE